MGEWGTRTLIALMSALLGGSLASGVMYLAVVGSYVSKDEVRQLIAMESPYLRDQKWLTETVRSFDSRLDRMNLKIDEVLTRLPE